MSLYEELKSNELYNKLIKELSNEEEKKEIESNLKELMDKFDNSIGVLIGLLGKE